MATANPSAHNSALSPNSPARVTKTVTSPWTQIVRGADSEAIPLSTVVVQDQIAVSSSDFTSTLDMKSSLVEESFDNGNVNADKKPAWNKPSNGAIEVGAVMGAVSWPALSECTRASSQKSISDSLKTVFEGSNPVSQVTGTASPQKQVNNNTPNSTPNHPAPTRQKSMKRGGGNAPANGGLSQPSGSPGLVVEIPLNNSSITHKSSNSEAGQRGGSQSHGGAGNDQTQHRPSYRRGNSGPHPRGDGSYSHNYTGRRDQDRVNHDWNHQRSFNGRDAHMQPQRGVPRGFIRPPPPPPHVSAPFISPQPVRPFGTPIGFPELASPLYYVPAPPPESLRGPFVAPIPPHAMFFSVQDPQLHTKLVNQIDYYFSNENLIKDIYLRQNMDDQGWVPIKLIAGFKKVMLLTDNIQFILEAVRTSPVVEVQGDKVRKRNDWMRWIMPPVQFAARPGSQSVGGMPSHETLANRVQNVALEEKNQAEGHFLRRSSSSDFERTSQVGSGSRGSC